MQTENTDTQKAKKVAAVATNPSESITTPTAAPMLLPVPEGTTFADGTRLRDAVRFPLSCEHFLRGGARGIYSTAIRLPLSGTNRLGDRIVCILPEDDEQAMEDYEELLQVVQSEEGERRDEHELFAGCALWVTRRWDDIAKELTAERERCNETGEETSL